MDGLPPYLPQLDNLIKIKLVNVHACIAFHRGTDLHELYKFNFNLSRYCTTGPFRHFIEDLH